MSLVNARCHVRLCSGSRRSLRVLLALAAVPIAVAGQQPAIVGTGYGPYWIPIRPRLLSHVLGMDHFRRVDSSLFAVRRVLHWALDRNSLRPGAQVDPNSRIS